MGVSVNLATEAKGMATRRSASRTANEGIGAVVRAFLTGALFAAVLLGALTLARGVLPTVADSVGGASIRMATATARLWHSLWAWVGAMTQSRKIALQQQQLQKRLARLEAENLRLRELAKENRRLRALLRLGEEVRQPFVAAEIIAIGGSHWFRTAIINRGSAEGVMPHTPVLNYLGVVGRVWEVHRHHSVVLLITDRRSAVGVALENHSKVFGIVKGTGGRYLELLHLSRRVLLRKGERLVTSGLGGIFPPDIPVGKIAHIDPDTEPPRFWVRPFVDDRNLHEVIVLTPKTPPMEMEPKRTLLPALPR